MPKIKVWTFIRDRGDGSYSVELCTSEAAAEALRTEEEETYGYSVDGAVDWQLIDTDEFEEIG